jgi:hypothetical protein
MSANPKIGTTKVRFDKTTSDSRYKESGRLTLQADRKMGAEKTTQNACSLVSAPIFLSATVSRAAGLEDGSEKV